MEPPERPEGGSASPPPDPWAENELRQMLYFRGLPLAEKIRAVEEMRAVVEYFGALPGLPPPGGAPSKS